MGRVWGCLCTIVLCFVFISDCVADVILLENGDRLTGRITKLENGKLVIETNYAGEVKVDLNKIQQLQAENVMTVEYNGTRRAYGTLTGSGKQITVQSIPASKIKDIMSGRVTGEEWNISGRVNAGLSDSSGNTNVSRAHFDAELVARKGRNRYTAGAAVNRAEDTDVETESNALAYFKYDRFWSPKWYNYINTTFERDKFKDIRLRTTIGLGTGYQALQSSRTNLALEAGVDYVREDFYVAPDDDFPALRLAVKYDYWILPDRLQFFNATEGFMSFGEVGNSFARMRTGLRFPVVNNFTGTLEYDVDWDGDPAPGRTSIDRLVLFSLGYKW